MTDKSLKPARESFALQRAEMAFARLRTASTGNEAPDSAKSIALRQKIRDVLLGHPAVGHA